jgi:DNA-binding transcriptional LysR family regulator
MKIRHLRIFKTVCEVESITKASEKLYITQPAVSNAISELENELGIQLFDRISRKLFLNESGKLFLLKVKKILELYDELGENTQELVTSALIKIGSSITIANFILPGALSRFETFCPQTPTRIIVENARNIEKMVNDNKVDLGLVEGIVYNDDLIKIPFSSYELSVICSLNHPFAQEESVDIKRLVKEKFLLREQGSAIRDVFDSALLLHDIKVNPVWTSVNSPALIQAVKHNLGISVLPKLKVEKELEKGILREVKVNNLELKNYNHIVFHKNKYQTVSFKKLIEIIQTSEDVYNL